VESKQDYLPKDQLLPHMQKRIAELDAAAARLTTALKNAPEGRLSISPHHGTYQYFHVNPNEVYIPKGSDLAQQLAQRDYDSRMLSLVSAQQNALRKCIEKYDDAKFEGAFDALHVARRQLVRPLVQSDKDFVKEWEETTYERLPVTEQVALQTSRGEKVRSKSEIIIANTLHHLGIPYKYECPLVIRQGRKNIKLHPDFTCLNVRTRKEYIWEHFGLMDDPEYANNAVLKINNYLTNGFIYGKNFLMTMESESRNFSALLVETLAKEFLL